jgi:serine/threonine protein kinase
VIEGVSELHRKKIVHCDIKPENIVRFGPMRGFPTFKLIDFDSACRYA